MSEIYVQLLTVIRPCPEYPNGRVLLCKWLTGDFQHRYTGLWGKYNSSTDGPNFDSAVVRIAESRPDCGYLPSIPIVPEHLKLVAILQFDVPVDNLEYIFLRELVAKCYSSLETVNSNTVETTNSSADSRTVTGQEQGEAWECQWFDWDQIPYDRMPADDKLWYPDVLSGKLLKGYFKFSGEPKYTVKEFNLYVVDKL